MTGRARGRGRRKIGPRNAFDGDQTMGSAPGHGALVPYMGSGEMMSINDREMMAWGGPMGMAYDGYDIDYGSGLHNGVLQGNLALRNQSMNDDHSLSLQQELMHIRQLLGAQEMVQQQQLQAGEIQGAFHEERTQMVAESSQHFDRFKIKLKQNQLDSHNNAKNAWAAVKEQREAEQEVADQEYKASEERQRIIDEGRRIASDAKIKKKLDKTHEERKAKKKVVQELVTVREEMQKTRNTMELEDAIKKAMKAKKNVKKERKKQVVGIADSSDLVSSFLNSGRKPAPAPAPVPVFQGYGQPMPQGMAHPGQFPMHMQFPPQRMLPAPTGPTNPFPWMTAQMGAMNLGTGRPAPVLATAQPQQQAAKSTAVESDDEDEFEVDEDDEE